MKKQITKKLVAVVSAIAIGTACIGAGVGATVFPKHIPEPYPVPGPETVKEVIKEVPVEVVVPGAPVEVDNGNLAMVQQFIVDQDGDLTDLDVSEIDDNGVAELVKQISFVIDAKQLAAQFVKDEIVDELDGMHVGNATLEDDDLEAVRVQDDFEDIKLDSVDYEDSDATAFVDVNFEQDDVKYVAHVKVKIRDGETDDLSIESVKLR